MAGKKLMIENNQVIARIKPFRDTVTEYFFERQGRHTVLRGVVGTQNITTSPVVRIDFESMMVETKNSLYRIVD